MTQQTELHARHQHQTLLARRELREGAGLELPLVVLYPAVLLLQFGLVGRTVVVIGQVLVVLAVPEREGRREGSREQELRTAPGEDGVDGRTAREGEAQVDVVARTVGNEEVLPVLEHVAGIGELSHEGEIVIRPAQTLTPSEGETQNLDILVGVVIVLVVVIAHTSISVEVVVVVVLVVGRVVVVVAHVGLLGEERADGQLVGTLASEPWIDIGYTVGLVVASVGLSADAERLTVALRQHSTSESALLEEVGHAEVAELQTYLTYHTRLAVTQ